MIRRVLMLLFALWLALGVGGKVLRYGPEREDAGPRADRLVQEFLQARGWALVDRTPITAAGMYASQSFAKPGCERRLQVVVLGASSEALDVVLASLGRDAAFLDQGRVSARPSAAALAVLRARAGLSLISGHAVPLLVVSPAPKTGDESSCAPPPAGAWSQIGAE